MIHPLSLMIGLTFGALLGVVAVALLLIFSDAKQFKEANRENSK